MTTHCNICAAPLGPPIFESDSPRSLTSLCELREVKSRVWSCGKCAHLVSDGVGDARGYYASDYRISLGDDEEDQVYEASASGIVYRTEHQATTLLRKLRLPERVMALDYGCAKASTWSKILAARPDVQLHLFDVSDMYRPWWRRLVPDARTAVDTTPPAWAGSFDVVTSFFAIEHIEQPRDTVEKLAALLAPDGVLYGIVPNVFGNVADFVVTDHVNHFTVPSLVRLLNDAGLGDVEIDGDAHRGALVFSARRGGARFALGDVEGTVLESREVAAYWSTLGSRVRRAELAVGDEDAAIYGAGFYGAWIWSTLLRPGKVVHFLDRSPFQQGRTLFGAPVVAPEALSETVRTLYVGLNPKIARRVMAEAGFAERRDLDLVFLDDSAA